MSNANGVHLKGYDAQQPRYHGKFIPRSAARPMFTPAFGGQLAVPPPAPSGPPAPDPIAAVLGAILLHAVRSHREGFDMVPGIRALVRLIRERGELAGVTGQSEREVQKAYWAAEERAWDPAVHPRDDGNRYVSRDLVYDARYDPDAAKELRTRVTRPAEREKLERALRGESHVGFTQKGARKDAVRTRAQARLDARRVAKRLRRFMLGVGATPGEVIGLADILAHLDETDLLRTAARLESVTGVYDARQREMIGILADVAVAASDLSPDDEDEDDEDDEDEDEDDEDEDEDEDENDEDEDEDEDENEDEDEDEDEDENDEDEDEDENEDDLPPEAESAPHIRTGVTVGLRRDGSRYCVSPLSFVDAAGCGVPTEFPASDLGTYMAALVSAGHRVLVCG